MRSNKTRITSRQASYRYATALCISLLVWPSPRLPPHSTTDADQQQRRNSQLPCQQEYHDRLRAQQLRWNARRYDYCNVPYFLTPASYGYSCDLLPQGGSK